MPDTEHHPDQHMRQRLIAQQIKTLQRDATAIKGLIVQTLDEQRSAIAGRVAERAPFHYLGGNRGLTYLSTGQPFFVNTDDSALTPWIIMGGHWETWADDILTAYVRRGMKIADVGSNVGYYAVKWGAIVGGSGELHAFEPNPDMIQFVYENLVLNGLAGHCTLHPHGAGCESTTATLTFTALNTGMATFRPTRIPPGRVTTVDVPIEPMDKTLADCPHLDLFKIDVEGFEPLVLRGAAALIARSPGAAFHLEAHVNWSELGGLHAILAPVMADRLLFMLGHDTSLTPVSIDDVQAVLDSSPNGIADLFLCPDGPDGIGRVERFVKRADRVEVSVSAVEPPRDRAEIEAAIRRQADDALAEADMLRAEWVEAVAQRDRIDDELAISKAELVILRTEWANAVAQRDKINEELTTAQAELPVLRTEWVTAVAHRDRLQAELDRAAIAAQALREEWAEAVAQRNEALRDVSTIRAEMEATLCENRGLIDERNHLVRIGEKERDRFRAETEALTHALDRERRRSADDKSSDGPV